MEELIYANNEVENLIKQKYPQAIIKDASDYIHTERFECEITNVTEDEFYPFAISEGFAKCCLGFLLHLESLKFPEPKTQPGKHKETIATIDKWVEAAKTLNKITG